MPVSVSNSLGAKGPSVNQGLRWIVTPIGPPPLQSGAPWVSKYLPSGVSAASAELSAVPSSIGLSVVTSYTS